MQKFLNLHIILGSMTKTVQEGLAKLVIDETAETESFYNPIQEFNRDVT